MYGEIAKRASSRAARGYFAYLSSIYSEVEVLERMFSEVVGHRFWDLQRSWCVRLLLGESFAMVAPTGVGKSTLLLVYALYAASQGKKVYIVVPTDNLLFQTAERLDFMRERLGTNVRILCYNSRNSKAKKEKTLEGLLLGEYDVFLSTSAFLSRHFEKIRSLRFDVVLVDDVDSILKKSVNIERVLLLIGFDEKDIENAEAIIRAKRELALARASIDQSRAERLAEEVERLRLNLSEALASKRVGQLVIASATGRQSGLKPLLFRELLGFEVGGLHDYMRNVIDAFELCDEEELPALVAELVSILGPGGLIFVPKDRGVAKAKEIAEKLRRLGLRAEVALRGRRALRAMALGELDVLVGVSSYYGTLVRGIDLPDKIKYAIFAGIPRNRLPLERALLSPKRLLQVLAHLEPETLREREVASLRSIVERLSHGELTALKIALEKHSLDQLRGDLAELGSRILELVGRVVEDARRKLCGAPKPRMLVGSSYIECLEGGSLYLVVPDVFTYLQASGRTSRLLNDKMTRGLSVVLETSREAVESLQAKASAYLRGFRLIPLSTLDLQAVREELEGSRKGELYKVKPAKSLLFIVESPTKARTIASFFGRPSRRRFLDVVVNEIAMIDPNTKDAYLALIVATRGHIFDLAIDDVGYHGTLLVGGDVVPIYAPITKCRSCGEVFSSISKRCPKCGEANRLKSSMDVVEALRRLSMEVETVIIATDPDAEGEKIAWDVSLMLRALAPRILRAEFHEVTLEAVLRALKNPREIDRGRVAAQVVRRVSDRWIGFSLSKKLWEKFGRRWLGAGRVQGPVLGWIVDRYDRWKREKGYRVIVKLEHNLKLNLFVANANEARDLRERLLSTRKVRIWRRSSEIRELTPPPPFTTDELISEANRLLGFAAPLTMRLAQELFEAGLITYHRTDSTRVSSDGLRVAQEYFEKRNLRSLYAPRSWDGAKGAHEAIRPTTPLAPDEVERGLLSGALRAYVPITEKHLKLYGLVFRRFMASQAKRAVAKFDEVEFELAGKRVEAELLEEILEAGFLALLGEEPRPSVKKLLERGEADVVSVELHRGSAVPLYTQGEIVTMMRERGIGRPSTYVTTLENLARHGYVVVSKVRKALVPTKLGIEIYSFLSSNYPTLVSEETTRRLEEEINSLERGELELRGTLSGLLRELELLGLYVMEPERIGVCGEELRRELLA